jgi:(1->4)-alpha-D-glucan 1-alpha-D-glucosylmutase
MSPAAPSSRRRRGARTPIVPLPLRAIPRATYRFQLHRDFGFADVTALVPYLAALGISHVYCSPYLKARPGSRHGYDIVDHRMLNPEIGTPAEFEQMVDALVRHGMSHLCDVVPNHMAIMGADNAWWMDVLEHGPASAYAGYFDIDWKPQDAELAGKVLVPVLGEPYGTVLERGELSLDFEIATGSFAVRYFEHRFPLDPGTYAQVLATARAEPGEQQDAPAMAEIERWMVAARALPARGEQEPERVAERHRASVALKERIAEQAGRHPPLAETIARGVARINGVPGEPETFDAIHALLQAQAFRLAYWRVASDEINYRRFFDVNGLAALRMENEKVFDAAHDFILALAAGGVIGGLRIDHPDGLFDPARYFRMLQERFRARVAHRGPEDSESPCGLYVVLEKIGAPHERLPETWPVHGTTGYRFANVVNALFVDPRTRARVDRVWRAFVGDEARAFEVETYRGRRAVMEGALASELAVLAQRALRLSRADRRLRDITFSGLREAIIEIVARFPVYRTYVDEDGPSASDRRHIDWALGRARASSRGADAEIYDFLHGAFLGTPPQGASGSARSYRDFAMHAQQFTAPVAAKGVEDTAFYAFNRLVSLNDVGGDPDQFGLTVSAYHGASADRAAVWPHTMLASSTHDNKRSEDTRARIDVISEVPAAWRLTVRRWSRINRSRKRVVSGQPAPSRNDEYLLYQTLVGTFPPQAAADADLDGYRERIERYMVKAAREAKVHTSWFAVDVAYEDALTGFVAALLRAPGENIFLPELRTQSAFFAWFGLLNSVSMALLKLTSPGVPDIYQGNEILDYSLVDPDNRRPVDYATRRAAVASLETLAAELATAAEARVPALFESPYDGRAKLWVILRALALRRERPALFAEGGYRRIAVTGAHAEHIVAFARLHGREGVVVAAGRLFASLGLAVGTLPLGRVWRDTALDLSFLPPATRLSSLLTDETFLPEKNPVRLAQLCAVFPCALLHWGSDGAAH